MRVDFELQSSGARHCGNAELAFIGCNIICRGEWKHASERAWVEETTPFIRNEVHVTIGEQRTYGLYMARCRL
jgi:hypothetical protein